MMNRLNLRRVSCISALTLAIAGIAAPRFSPNMKPRVTTRLSYRIDFWKRKRPGRRPTSAFDDITQKLLAALDRNSTYADASKEADAAQAAFDAMNDSALASLRNDPAYKTEITARDAAKHDLERARETGQATDEEKTDLAKAVMMHNAAIHKMESDAAKNIPGLSVAKSKAMAAQARLTLVKAGYMKQVSQDPQWAAAKSAMEATHEKVSRPSRRSPEFRTKRAVRSPPIPSRPIRDTFSRWTSSR